MKFLVIGLGSIGTRHAKNLVSMGHEVAGYDPFRGVSDGIQQAISYSGDDYDGVLICAPTSCHRAYLWQMENTHIFVEKPIAAEYEPALDLILEKKKKTNKIVMVGNMLRFHPNVIMAKSLIKDPKSALFQVLQKNDKPAYRRDGILLNWGAHEIDLALYLLGPAKVIGAKVHEDFAAVTLEHENGTVSIISMDYLTEPEMRGFEITEKDGTTHEVNLTLHDWNNIYIEEMKAFIGLIEGKPDPRCATGEDGLATLRLIDKAKEMAS